MKLNELLAAVDSDRPNGFERERKIAWIDRLERRIAELYAKYEGLCGIPFSGYDGESGECELLAPEAYCDVYAYWLYFKMDFTAADGVRASDAGAMFSAAWDELCAWVVREHRARSTPAMGINGTPLPAAPSARDGSEGDPLGFCEP